LQKENIEEPGSSHDRNLYFIAGISLLVFITGIYILSTKYIIPVFNNEITFIHDFSFYKAAAERFINDPSDIYNATDLQQELSYLYPPPAVLIFLPFAGNELASSYLVFLVTSFLFLVAAVFILIRTAELILKSPLTNNQKIIIYIISAGNTPVYMNFQSSQIGTILIFIVALFLYLIIKQKYFPAGIILSLGVLIKIYPVFLILTGYGKGTAKKFLSGFILSLILIPLLSLTLMPVSVYNEFIFHILPGLASYTELNAYNQSLIPVILRFFSNTDGGWLLVEIPLYLKLINYFFLLTLIVYTGYKLLKTKQPEEISLYSLIILAAIPVFSTFGWGHLYILALPIIMLYVFMNKDKARIIPLFLVFAVDIPDAVFSSLNIPFNSWFYQVFQARFLLITIYIISCLLIQKGSAPVKPGILKV